MIDSLIRKLTEGNRDFTKDGSVELRLRTAREGQHPYAVVNMLLGLKSNP